MGNFTIVKAFYFIYAFLYLSFNLGLGFSAHYCMGFLQNVSLGHVEHKCCCSEIEMMSSCCDDLHFDYQNDENQNFAQCIKLIQPELSEIIPFQTNPIASKISFTEVLDYSVNDPPPKLSCQRVFIQSLIYYA